MNVYVPDELSNEEIIDIVGNAEETSDLCYSGFEIGEIAEFMGLDISQEGKNVWFDEEENDEEDDEDDE